ncbi:MAG: hypothetical protein H0W73_11020 [Bacteroidetes bacterium]|nr:hypothetical protein [Bacteroidota bacterium]
MNQNIQIQKPCAENFNAMSSVTGGKHCGVCDTKVIDFTKMSLDEIETYFKSNSFQKICGRYNARHTNNTNIFTAFINKIENAVYKTRFRKVAVWSLSVVFFLLNSYKCMGKRMDPVNKYEGTAKNDTIVKPK